MKHTRLSATALLNVALALTACAPPIENDPIYQQLKANPPTVVPERHIRVLKSGMHISCDVFNEGDRQRQYMTCWFGNNNGASLSYYPPYPPNPPRPSIANESNHGIQLNNLVRI